MRRNRLTLPLWSTLPLLLVWVTACPADDQTAQSAQNNDPKQAQPSPKAGKQGEPATPEQTVAVKRTTESCAANPAWITSPSLPSDVPTPISNCSFQQFMWQSLLYLVQPSSTRPGALEFETWMPSYGIFVGEGQTPTPWGQVPSHPCTPADGSSDAPMFSNIIKQAGADHPLLDRNGNHVYYGIAINQPGYDMLVQCDLYRSNCASNLDPGNSGIDLGAYPNLAFPNPTVVLKSAWQVVPDGDPNAGNFYTTKGWIQHPETKACQLVTLGLVGLHVVSKTPTHPEFLWATFEHRSNAPDCTDLAAKPPIGDAWTFFDAATCDNCETNQYRPPNPTQVCRMHPWGDPTEGTMPNGVDCKTNPNQYICKPEVRADLADNSRNLVSINGNAQALISTNPGPISRVWANYELVGNVWTDQGVLPPALEVQEGSLAAANTVMETYVQNGVSNIANPTSCFTCHNLDSETFGVQLPPAGLSHIFTAVVPNTGGCPDGKLPTTCAAYH